MGHAIIYWDIDGTLTANDPHASDIYNQALHTLTGITANPAPSPHGKTNKQIIQEHLKAAGANISLEPELTHTVETIWQHHYTTPNNHQPALPGAHETLHQLTQHGYIHALFTGNPATRSKTKLEKANINPDIFNWEISFFGTHYHSRTQMAEAAQLMTQTLNTSAIMIGDTPKDGEAARTAQTPFIAITTGIYTAEDLAPYTPALTLTTLTGATPHILNILRTHT